MKNDVFVKINCKTLGELKSTIIDKGSEFNIHNNKYMMCAGKHTKEGWSLVFKASSVEEAEAIIASNRFMSKESKRVDKVIEPIINVEDRVLIPSWG